MEIKIITDSTADLEPKTFNTLDIGVVPIYVRFGDRIYRDGIEISKREFYQRLKTSKVHPATSQPPPEDFTRFYTEALKEAKNIVSIHISSRISGTYNSALMAQQTLEQGSRVKVIDSRFNSAGLGLVVKAAAMLAKSGASLSEIMAETYRVIDHVHMFGMFETMKYLARSGRVNKTIAAAANFLNVMPLLTFHNGEIVRTGLVRSISKGMERIYEFVKARIPVTEIAIVHSDVPDQAHELKSRLSGLVRAELISITELGAALGVHGGPGVLVLGLRTE